MKKLRFLIALVSIFTILNFTTSFAADKPAEKSKIEQTSVQPAEKAIVQTQTKTVDTGFKTTSTDTVVKKDGVPQPGASWKEWVYYFLFVVIGTASIRAFILRLIPTPWNIDIVEKTLDFLFYILNFVLGKWTANRKSGGGTH